MRTKTTITISALLLIASANVSAQSNDADSTTIFSGPRSDPNWQGASYYQQPQQPTSPPVYELPEEPNRSFECSVENGCMSPEHACAMGGDMYCQPEEPSPNRSFECSVENGCMSPEHACAMGGDMYCN